MKAMNELMLHFMQDIYYAEKLGVRSMAKLAKAVENKELKDAILAHREQSQQQIERLDQVFEALGKRAKSKTCAAMNGLVEEGEEAADEFDRGPVLDAALIACGQAIEHYEIARYGAMVAWAKQLGLTEAAGLLQQTLDEEKANDAALSELAERVLNPEASKQAAGGHDRDAAASEPKAEAKKKRVKKPV